MTELLAVATAIGCIACALTVCYILFKRDRMISPLMLFLLESVVFINIGYVLYFWEYRTYDWSVQALMVSSIGLSIVSAAGFATAVVHRSTRPSTSVLRDVTYHQAMLAALGVFALASLYFFLLGYVPLFEGFKTLFAQGFVPGLTNTYRVGRDIYVNPEARYIPFQGFMEAIRYYALPVVMVWFVHLYRLGSHRAGCLLVLCLSTLLLVATGQRWPLMNALITLVIYLFWTYRPRRLATRGTLLITSIAVACGLFLSILLGRTSAQLTARDALLFGLRDLTLRILLGNSRVPFESYSVFPRSVDFLWGRSWVQNLLAYLPGAFASFPVTFYQMVTGDTRGHTAPPDFYTEAFINFGWPGVAIICAMWGVMLSLVHEAMLRKARQIPLTKLSLYSLWVTWLGGTWGGLSCLVGVYIVILFLRVDLWISRLVFGSRSSSIRATGAAGDLASPVTEHVEGFSGSRV